MGRIRDYFHGIVTLDPETVVMADDGENEGTSAHVAVNGNVNETPASVVEPSEHHGRQDYALAGDGGQGDLPQDWTSHLALPSPSLGGHPGPSGELGWSDGLGHINVRSQGFSGAFLEPPYMGVGQGAHDGQVGYSARNSILSQRVNNAFADNSGDDSSAAIDFQSYFGEVNS